MKKILVPTDLTPIAELGLKLAAEIAKRSGATVSLVNFTKHPFGQTFSSIGETQPKADEEGNLYALQLLQATKTRLQELTDRYSSDDVSIDFSVVDDGFKNGIDEWLQQENIDLIVMGTSGEESGKEVFAGNHTEQVIKISSCPVLSVRDGFAIDQFDNMVVAVNVIEDGQIATGLAVLGDLARCFNAHVHMVHVRDRTAVMNPALDTYFKQMAEAAALQHYFITILDAADPAEAVIAFARDVKAGLIAVIKNTKDGIFSMLSNHFSNRLVKEVGRPVFTFNLQNTAVKV